MTDSFLLLNDGSSQLLLNDGSSFLLLNGDVADPGRTGMMARIRSKFRVQEERRIEYSEFKKLIAAKPTRIMTNEVSFKGIPLIRQYMVRTFKMNPLYKTDEEMRMSLKSLIDRHTDILVRAKPLVWNKESKVFVKVQPKVDEYFAAKITGKSLNGINIIRKAMMLDGIRTFSFRESSQNWESAATLSDLDKRIKRLNDKIDDLERDLNPREKDFIHPSSFVGTVTYTPESNSMEITMNGKVYGFCGVPERIFDEFEGSPSKGSFYNRSIRGQFNCG